MTCGIEWTLLVRADVGGDALIIDPADDSAALILAEMFNLVEVWVTANESTDCSPTVSSPGNASIIVRNVQAGEMSQRLSQLGKRWSLLAIDNSNRGLGKDLFDLIDSSKNFLKIEGQLCVITEHRFSLKRLINDLRIRSQNPSIRTLKSRLYNAGILHWKVYFPYRDGRRSLEILGWNTATEGPKRRSVARFLRWLGLESLTHSSVVLVGSRHSTISVLQQFGESNGLSPSCRAITRCFVRPSGTVVAIYRDQHASGVLRIPLKSASLKRLEHARSVTEAVASEFEWLGQMVPPPISNGKMFGLHYFLEGKCTGVPASKLATSEGALEAIVSNATQIQILFASRARNRLDGHLLSQELHSRYFRPIAEYAPGCANDLRVLEDLVVRAVGSCSLPFVQTHGDFNPSNVLFSPQTGEVTGLVDWDASEKEGLPLLDLLHFLLGLKPECRGVSVGRRVHRSIVQGGWTSLERQALNLYMDAVGLESRLLNAFLVMYWCRHICLHVHYRSGPLGAAWEEENLYGVLRNRLILESIQVTR